jgi:hypothetical protein
MHVYEVRPRTRIIAASISFPMFSHSVGSGIPSRMTQLATRSIAVVHMTLLIRVYDAAGNVIETGEHKGEFKEP